MLSMLYLDYHIYREEVYRFRVDVSKEACGMWKVRIALMVEPMGYRASGQGE